jgi:DNA-binding beta-propeller fold protein YncE
VVIFAPGQTSPTATLSQGIYNPSPLAVDAKNHLYVGSLNPDARSVSVFDASSASPLYTIRSGAPDPRMLALDGNGDLYVANSGTGGIAEYTAGQRTPHLKIDIKADDIAIAP